MDILELLKDEIGGEEVSDSAPCITHVRVLRLAIECIESLCRRTRRLESDHPSYKTDYGEGFEEGFKAGAKASPERNDDEN